ncbi:unnamed protein product [Spirodela intermedia]|uniref:Uncharacterized protein n=1 Tax=Spirodela intermedia TaxID=51605 RepID=A0A7I8KFG0_SPIIN|nr:unnamed protein product [Spirodela intermedia]
MAALRDLRVSILRSSILRPPENVERRLIFLSNIDQQLDFNVETIHFFLPNLEFPPDAVAKRLESAMEELLASSYDFLAGRLSWDESEARWELDCNGAGVGFVEAASELTLAELGDLELPNPVLSQLAAGKADAMDIEDRPLFVIRLTAFKCGAFAMGISNSHATFDGVGFRTFMENLAALAAAKPLALPPCNDRRLLAARSPPRVVFPHPELFKLKEVQLGTEQPPTLMETSPESIGFKCFRLSTEQISALKSRARADGSPPSAATGFNVVAAHLWRCKALAGGDVDPDKTSTVLYAVDIRERLRPPLPRSFAGNAVLSAYGGMTHRELREEPFGRVVEVVREGSARMDEDYVRSAIDWGQLYKGFPRGDVLISSWWRLGLDEVEFSWGKALCCVPLPDPHRDIAVLFPASGGAGQGMRALVPLPAGAIPRFERLFYDFL